MSPFLCVNPAIGGHRTQTRIDIRAKPKTLRVGNNIKNKAMELRFKFENLGGRHPHVSALSEMPKRNGGLESFLNMAIMTVDFPDNLVSSEVVVTFSLKMKKKRVVPENPDPKGDPFGVLVKSVLVEFEDWAAISYELDGLTTVVNANYIAPSPRGNMFDRSHVWTGGMGDTSHKEGGHQD